MQGPTPSSVQSPCRAQGSALLDAPWGNTWLQHGLALLLLNSAPSRKTQQKPTSNTHPRSEGTPGSCASCPAAASEGARPCSTVFLIPPAGQKASAPQPGRSPARPREETTEALAFPPRAGGHTESQLRSEGRGPRGLGAHHGQRWRRASFASAVEKTPEDKWEAACLGRPRPWSGLTCCGEPAGGAQGRRAEQVGPTEVLEAPERHSDGTGGMQVRLC